MGLTTEPGEMGTIIGAPIRFGEQAVVENEEEKKAAFVVNVPAIRDIVQVAGLFVSGWSEAQDTGRRHLPLQNNPFNHLSLSLPILNFKHIHPTFKSRKVNLRRTRPIP